VVDRPTLIKSLDPIAKPTASQAENIRKSLEKALTDIVLALPLEAARQLGATEKAELAHFLSRLDPKSLEKLAKIWEPKRKLDVELKRTLAVDLIALLEAKRAPYVPFKLTLDAARGDAAAIGAALAHAPAKDLSTVFKSWDKHNKSIPEQRLFVIQRLQALLDGEAPVSSPARSK
jgi:hypothetical protein